jgi:hypothetical protein
LTLRRIDMAVAAGRLADAAADYQAYRDLMVVAVPTLLNNAEQWSLFTKKVHDAHYGALRQTMLARRAGQ